jgi:hypothetical protein
MTFRLENKNTGSTQTFPKILLPLLLLLLLLARYI